MIDGWSPAKYLRSNNINGLVIGWIVYRDSDHVYFKCGVSVFNNIIFKPKIQFYIKLIKILGHIF